MPERAVVTPGEHSPSLLSAPMDGSHAYLSSMQKQPQQTRRQNRRKPDRHDGKIFGLVHLSKTFIFLREGRPFGKPRFNVCCRYDGLGGAQLCALPCHDDGRSSIDRPSPSSPRFKSSDGAPVLRNSACGRAAAWIETISFFPVTPHASRPATHLRSRRSPAIWR